MNIRILTSAGLAGLVLLMTGCGGGGGARPTTPVDISSFNLNTASKDSKAGATYLQESLTAKSDATTTRKVTLMA